MGQERRRHRQCVRVRRAAGGDKPRRHLHVGAETWPRSWLTTTASSGRQIGRSTTWPTPASFDAIRWFLSLHYKYNDRLDTAVLDRVPGRRRRRRRPAGRRLLPGERAERPVPVGTARLARPVRRRGLSGPARRHERAVRPDARPVGGRAGDVGSRSGRGTRPSPPMGTRSPRRWPGCGRRGTAWDRATFAGGGVNPAASGHRPGLTAGRGAGTVSRRSSDPPSVGSYSRKVSSCVPAKFARVKRS